MTPWCDAMTGIRDGHRLIRVMPEHRQGGVGARTRGGWASLARYRRGGMLRARRDHTGDRIRGAHPAAARRRRRPPAAVAALDGVARTARAPADRLPRPAGRDRHRAGGLRQDDACSPNGRCATSGRSRGCRRRRCRGADRCTRSRPPLSAPAPRVIVLDEADRVAVGRSATDPRRRAKPSRAGSMLALGSRAYLDEPTGRLRAHGLLLELGPDELSLTHLEAARMMASAGLALGDDQLSRLLARTEGWPAALSLRRDRARGRARRRPRDRRLRRRRPDRRGLPAVRPAGAPDLVRARAPAPVLGPLAAERPGVRRGARASSGSGATLREPDAHGGCR